MNNLKRSQSFLPRTDSKFMFKSKKPVKEDMKAYIGGPLNKKNRETRILIVDDDMFNLSS